MGLYRKGDLAQVRDSASGRPMGIHVYTAAEYKEVCDDPFFYGIDSAGEPRIPPMSTHVTLMPGEILHVLNARSRPPDIYNRKSTGWMLTVSTRTGQEIYVKRSQLKPVAEATTDQETETL